MRALLTSFILYGLCCTVFANESKTAKNIGIFNVVKFPNTECEGGNSQNGTCYTTEECEDKSGTADGTCAEGYGVCCIFTINCGGSSSENITTFQSPGGSSLAGACNAEICKISSDVGQLRLDFTTFTISDPEAHVAASLTHVNLNGAASFIGGAAYTSAGQCSVDTFSVTSPGSSGTPVICGTNTGEHMYVDASDSCNTLSFHLSEASTVTPMWSIIVTQYSNDYANKAPPNCLQYHFGSATGQIRSFNWNEGNGRHLANQNQLICIRREATMNRICYSQAGGAVVNDFLISTGVAGDSASAQSGVVGISGSFCGNYGMAGAGVEFDYLNIPMPSNAATVGVGFGAIAAATNGNFCGGGLVAAAAAVVTAGPPVAAQNIVTVCSQSLPFQVRFVSDEGEGAMETIQSGFQLGYIQTSV